MNKFAIAFLILLFLVLLGVGLIAIRKQIFLKSKALDSCPVPVLTSDLKCPVDTKLNLVKDSNGCYAFDCK